MVFGMESTEWPGSNFADGSMTAKEFIKYHCPFRIKNAVVQVHDGWVYVWNKDRKRKPWEARDKDYRATTSYRGWRKAVFERDNFTCCKCASIGGKLEAHHIKTFHHFPELRFDVSNGLTLCRPCHMKEHGRAKR